MHGPHYRLDCQVLRKDIGFSVGIELGISYLINVVLHVLQKVQLAFIIDIILKKKIEIWVFRRIGLGDSPLDLES